MPKRPPHARGIETGSAVRGKMRSGTFPLFHEASASGRLPALQHISKHKRTHRGRNWNHG